MVGLPLGGGPRQALPLLSLALPAETVDVQLARGEAPKSSRDDRFSDPLKGHVAAEQRKAKRTTQKVRESL